MFVEKVSGTAEMEPSNQPVSDSRNPISATNNDQNIILTFPDPTPHAEMTAWATRHEVNSIASRNQNICYLANSTPEQRANNLAALAMCRLAKKQLNGFTKEEVKTIIQELPLSTIGSFGSESEGPLNASKIASAKRH